MSLFSCPNDTDVIEAPEPPIDPPVTVNYTKSARFEGV